MGWRRVWLCVLVTTGCEFSEREHIYDSELGLCNDGEGRLYPLEKGAWWRVRVTDDKTLLPECPDKVVLVVDDGAVPFHSGTMGYAVLSNSKSRVGRRWQGFDGDSTYRYVDQWGATPTSDPSSIKLFCPRKLRVPGGHAACEGQISVDEYRSVTLTVDDETDWQLCEELRFDPDTCDALDDVPPECLLEYKDSMKTTTVIDAFDAVSVPAGEFEALHLRTEDGEEVVDFWWARGIGKVREVETEQFEELVDYCLPATGCTRPPPDSDALTAECQMGR